MFAHDDAKFLNMKERGPKSLKLQYPSVSCADFDKSAQCEPSGDVVRIRPGQEDQSIRYQYAVE